MERLRLDSVTGEASTLHVMQLLAEAVEHVVKNKDWKNAFQGCEASGAGGAGGAVHGLSDVHSR